jgi:hypothetical protein
MKKYRPSSGSEGIWFCGMFCDQCINQHPDPNNKKQCMILCRTLCHSINEPEYPTEWVYDENNNPTCTAFVKWDWNNDGDPDDPDNPKAPIPENPMQLTMPFIFDEIGISKQTSQTV